MKITLNAAICICAFTLLSCQTGNESLCTVQATMPANASQVIPLETALATLSDFLESNEAGMLPTRSGRTREIASVSGYFGKSVSSRASSDSGEETPVAYLVNFMDGEGFAVLGARSSVPDIVAVTESGRIDDDLTVRFSMSDDDIANDEDKDDPNDNPGEDPDDLISYYCEEDGDYYSDADCNEAFISECIRAGISEAEDNEYDEGDRPIEDEGGGGGYVPYTTRSPMLKTNWGQNDPYNRYCFRRNLVGKKKQALTGCTTTAMSMIVACNEFPQTLEINGEILGWKGMKTSDLAKYLSDKGQDDVARLMGGIYSSVSKIARKEYTLITPEQIKKRMREFGYDNVEKHSASSLNSSMIKRTSDMLAKGKPVFISAIPVNFTRAHSWVIDGAMYSSKNKYNYLLHCNFGWGGKSNGYFSTACLNPAKAESYDYKNKNNVDDDYTYSWHFRLITYDIPANPCTMSINYSY